MNLVVQLRCLAISYPWASTCVPVATAKNEIILSSMSIYTNHAYIHTESVQFSPFRHESKLMEYTESGI